MYRAILVTLEDKVNLEIRDLLEYRVFTEMVMVLALSEFQDFRYY